MVVSGNFIGAAGPGCGCGQENVVDPARLEQAVSQLVDEGPEAFATTAVNRKNAVFENSSVVPGVDASGWR